MTVYINGIAYDACSSRYFNHRCSDRTGHDGKHHSGHWYWTSSEAATWASAEMEWHK